MSDTTQSASTREAANAPGGRRSQTGNNNSSNGAAGALAAPEKLGEGLAESNNAALGSKSEGFGLDGEDVKGTLKIHIKLNLEADIRVIAKIKGDIAIGLM